LNQGGRPQAPSARLGSEPEAYDSSRSPRDLDVAEVVERPARRGEPGVDLIELRRVERRAEAAEAVAVREPELGGEVVALEQADIVDAAGSGSAARSRLSGSASLAAKIRFISWPPPTNTALMQCTSNRFWEDPWAEPPRQSRP
jgi:hypothetical protein